MSDPQQRRRTCGTMVVHNRLLSTDPAYAAARVASENNAFGARLRGVAGRVGTTRIPVVVHVVFNNARPGQNIADAQIQSQVDVLNRDFRLRNLDAATAPPVFRALAGD